MMKNNGSIFTSKTKFLRLRKIAFAIRTSLLVVGLSFGSQLFAADGESLLDKTVAISGFGNIRYRAPLLKAEPDHNGAPERFPIVLVHGIYGGASHRTWRALLPELDNAGEDVYLMDLPGAGESDRPQRAYSLEDMDTFIQKFLAEVVKTRANVVAESIISSSALRVASQRPDLIRRLILISPTGVNSLHRPPSPREQQLYDRLYNDETGANLFYQNLLGDSSLRYFLAFSFFNDSLIDEALLNDYRVARNNLEQKWLTLSFVGGQLWRPFSEAAAGVFVPVLGLFGAEYEAFGDNPPSTAAQFQAIRPDFTYFEIPQSGASLQREQPGLTAHKIREFTVVD